MTLRVVCPRTQSVGTRKIEDLHNRKMFTAVALDPTAVRISLSPGWACRAHTVHTVTSALSDLLALWVVDQLLQTCGMFG